MAELKLARLPDRTPVKISVMVTPLLNQRLAAYADAYKKSYGQEEKVADLIPFMLEQFLNDDREFKHLAGNPRRQKSTDRDDRV
jgi:hypothetical protein